MSEIWTLGFDAGLVSNFINIMGLFVDNEYQQIQKYFLSVPTRVEIRNMPGQILVFTFAVTSPEETFMAGMHCSDGFPTPSDVECFDKPPYKMIF